MNTNPGKTEFSAAEHADVRRRVQEALTEDGMSQAALVNAANVPSSTLSQYLGDKYPNEKGKAETAVKLTRWLDNRAAAKELRGHMAIKPSFQPLKAAEKIHAVLNFAHAAGELVLIGGVPGTQKTAALRQFAATNPRTWYTSMDPTTAGVPTMLLEILAAMGVKDAKGTPQVLMRQICEETAKGRGLIIVDEAQHLSDKALEALRAINDRMLTLNGEGIGIALAGNELAQSKVASTGSSAIFAQVSSRIGKRLWFNRPLAEDAAALARAWGEANGEEISKAEVAFCQEIAAKPGGLRNVEKTFKGAIMTARAMDQALTLEHLQHAYGALGGR